MMNTQAQQQEMERQRAKLLELDRTPCLRCGNAIWADGSHANAMAAGFGLHMEGGICLMCKAVVDGKEPTRAVNPPPSGQAASSPANGIYPYCRICKGGTPIDCICATANGKGPISPKDFSPFIEALRHDPAVDDARFDERVACAALVLGMQEKATTGSTLADIESYNALLTHISKAILSRGAK